MALAPSSPRLPSPPPPAEIQIGPNSPSGGAAASLHATPMEQSLLDANSKRRIHPGTKSCDMAAGPPLTALNELDSAFQLQEHLAALHAHHSANGTRPIDRDTAVQLAQPPPGIDRTLWLYELCRFLISQCNSLIVGFLFDAPACSATTCPEMRASEWQFLCAVHEQPKSCCAIDYCCHTLDWAANVVTDQKLFPSRFVVLSDPHSKNVGVKNLVNVFRRLHRIFAHAWFQHRSVFWSVEGQTGLYVFFKTVCDLYDLLPAENYKLPPEAEGLEAPPSEPEPERPTPAILKPPREKRDSSGAGAGAGDDGLHAGGASRTNTRRHIRSSPSTGSAVTTVMEAEEEEADGVAQKVKELHISNPDASEAEEPESADVPMMVENESVWPVVRPQEDAPALDEKKPEAEMTSEADVNQTTTGEPSTEEPDAKPQADAESDENTDEPAVAEPTKEEPPQDEGKPPVGETPAAGPVLSGEEPPFKEAEAETKPEPEDKEKE
ncbi:MOB kinase activator-like-like protein [Hapsidospora chrysogenum ATCC 11550]|uniref:MOB kinase activator-like-like protein n=1 Tax=Hapsidospora chrysogenum (strain ATCC 11550 / CBS 779.69 / DSM 880 / IAM 14645 / JCM 23072 / IMI 49137) TaxID=857340 RepID=A0A086TEM3_HAPC1|nr:MOB kinase activator-like-like protein [Hapsidospora chrysogenum ATCC 11550]